MLILTLLACGEKDDTGPGVDTAVESECHPNLPYPEACYTWQFDGCNDGNDTWVAKVADGRTDADGNFTMTETWYWFKGEGWEDDCIDVFEYKNASPLTAASLQALNASEAEEGFKATMTKVTDGCPGNNYLYLWDHPDKDEFEYGDGVEQEVVLIFDTLSSGNLNFENRMLVFVGYNVGGNSYTMRTDYATGTYSPEDESNPLDPPAGYAWETSSCLDG
mgnify:CR=1 FL=1